MVIFRRCLGTVFVSPVVLSSISVRVLFCLFACLHVCRGKGRSPGEFDVLVAPPFKVVRCCFDGLACRPASIALSFRKLGCPP